ncbi:MAG TPA: substrate-binding domain-containing protein, partial [Capillimicrobium sp.]|nr:substrate-binding domain-containing protein [Capillimicrobium sp.]
MTKRSILSLVAVGASALALGACGSDDEGSTSTSGGASTSAGGGGKIALLLPESKTARYESQDRPNFENKVSELCSDCEIIYSNADQDASKQQSQAEAALTEGAEVLVLDPVDSASAAAIVNRAKQSDVPVISYDRLILDAPVDYYISFDNVKVGELQANALSEKLSQDGNAKGPIIKINGA